MLSPGILVRRILAHYGYVLSRADPEVPPSMVDWLRTIVRHCDKPVSVVCFDNETLIQSEILEVFPESRVLFTFPLLSLDGAAPLLGSKLPPPPIDRFIAVIDIEEFSFETLVTRFPWLKTADAVLFRGRLGSFWTGARDGCQLVAQAGRQGFRLIDVIGLPGLSLLQAPATRVALIGVSSAAASLESAGSRYRKIEALTYLSEPIVRRQDFQMLAARGSFGYAAGVFNPGAIVEDGKVYLLPRADRTPWALQKADESLFLTSPQPLLLALDDGLRVSHAEVLVHEGLAEPLITRTEDFRLFQFRSQIFSNHSVISPSRRRSTGHHRLRMEEIRTRVGISTLEVRQRRLDWCGFPSIDRPLAQTEKNWAIFSNGDRLLLLYSFAPYTLMAADKWPDLSFETILEKQIYLPFAGDSLPVRNSINPVDYDGDHWLHIVHKVYPGKQYCFWGVLINKRTLWPVQVTARPFVRNWHSCSASIVYTCAAIARSKDILLYAGLDDSAVAVALIPRSRIDAEWEPIATRQP